METPSNVAFAELARTAEEAVRVFADGEDPVRLSSAVGLAGWARLKQGQLDAGRDALLEAAAQARMIGDSYREAESLRFVAEVLVVGDEHVDAALAEVKAIRERVAGQPLATAHLELRLAELEAFRGRVEDARALSRRAQAVLLEFDNESGQVESLGTCALVERYAGELASAEAALRDALALATRHGDAFHLGSTASRLAEVLALRGRDAEASAHLATAEGLYETAPDLGLWRSVRARLLVRSGERVEALSRAREAVELARSSGTFVDLAHRLFDLGEVLHGVGWDDEARVALKEALAMFERKGDVVYGARTRALLEGLPAGAAAS
jgi:tetratricopeptide (TPR) repeat protein